MPRYERDDDDDDRPRRARRRDDDDDDRPIRKSSGGDTATKVLLIIGAVILGIFLICGGVTLYIYNSVKSGVQDVGTKFGQKMDELKVESEKRLKEMEEKQAKQAEEEKKSDYGKAKLAAETFMQNVKGRRYDAIHKYATESFQKRMTVEQLQKLVEANADHLDSFRGIERPWGDQSLTGTTFVFDQQLMTAFGFKQMKITMVNEKDEWKLDQFIVENKK